MVIVSGCLYSVSENPQTPMLIHTFDPTSVWDHFLSDRKDEEGIDEKEVERVIESLKYEC